MSYSLKSRVFHCMIMWLITFLCHVDMKAETVPHTLIWWKTNASDSLLSIKERLEAVDSLLIYNPYDISTLLLKEKLLAEDSRFADIILFYENLDKDQVKLETSDLLRIQFDYLYALQTMGRNMSLIQKADNFLTQNIPDSLSEYKLAFKLFQYDVSLQTGQTRTAREYLDESHELSKKILKNNRSPNLASNLNQKLIKAEILYSIWTQDFEKGLQLLDSARNLLNNPQGIIFIDVHAPIIYDGLGESLIADKLYQKSLTKIDDISLKLIILNNYISFLLKNYRYNDAYSIINKYTDWPDWLKKHPYYALFLSLKAQTESYFGKYQEAYNDLSISSSMKDSISQSEIQADAIHGIEQLKLQNEIKDLNASRKNLWMIILVLFLILGTAVCLIIKEKILNKKQKILLEEKEKLISEMDDSHNMDITKHVDKIDSQQRKLISQTMQLARISGSINQIKDIISTEEKSDLNKLNDINGIIKDFTSDRELWDAFTFYFEMTNANLVKNIYRECPNITARELRLCAFIVLNLTTKEIALITRRSPRSVETMKYRLGKKFNISENDTLANRLLYLKNKVFD